MLDKHNLTSQHPDLVKNLREGFPMGDFPELKSTVIFANDSSVDDHHDFVTTYIRDEVASGRMSGPYTQSEVEDILQGPFQCSPMLVSEQAQGPGEPPKLRLCRNLSKGTRAHPSTNDYIDKDNFPTKFGTAAQVAEIVSPYPLPSAQHGHQPSLLPPFVLILFAISRPRGPYSRLRPFPLASAPLFP
jgi:hypothetical protein